MCTVSAVIFRITSAIDEQVADTSIICLSVAKGFVSQHANICHLWRRTLLILLVAVSISKQRPKGLMGYVVFSGARPAHDACFEDVNAAGNAFGNCGKDGHGNYMKCEKR